MTKIQRPDVPQLRERVRDLESELKRAKEALRVAVATERAIRNPPWTPTVEKQAPLRPHAKPERNQEIIAAVAGGTPKAEVARRFGISPTTVGYIVQREEWRTTGEERHSLWGGLSPRAQGVLRSLGATGLADAHKVTMEMVREYRRRWSTSALGKKTLHQIEGAIIYSRRMQEKE